MWFLLALLAGLLFAVNRLLVRSALLRGGNPIAFAALHNLTAGVLLLPAAWWNPMLPQSAGTWAIFLVTLVAFFLGDLAAFLALERIEASIYQILGQVRHIIVLLGGSLLFAEAISAPKIISIILLMTGVMIALVEKSKVRMNKGIAYGLISPVFISFGFLGIKELSGDVSLVYTASISLIFSGIMAYMVFALRGGIRTKLVLAKNRTTLLVAAAIFSVFEVVLFAALDQGEASKVAPVAQSSLLFTLIGGYLFLRERDRIRQKIAGSVLVSIGIGLLFFY